MLRGRKTGLKWRRQVSIGVYVADFYCAEKKIALELDGNQQQEEKAREYDEIRDAFFKSRDITVIRISNKELTGDPSIIYEKISNETVA